MHASLKDFGITRLSEEQKIHHFEHGIVSPSLAPVKAGMVLNQKTHTTFAQVMQVYTDFRAATKAANPAPGHSASSVDRSPTGRGRGGHGGRSDSCQDGCKRGGHGSAQAWHPNNLPSQEEVDKCTNITESYYPNDVYVKMTPAEKQKLSQSRTSRKMLSAARAVSQLSQQFATAILTVVSEITTKTPAKKTSNDNEAWGRDWASNHDNPNLDHDSFELDRHQPKKPMT